MKTEPQVLHGWWQSSGSSWESGFVRFLIGDDGWEMVAESVSASAAGISVSGTGGGMAVIISAEAGEPTAASADGTGAG